MEYLAFGLLGLGAIFILIGISSARNEKPIIEKTKAEKAHKLQETVSSPIPIPDQKENIAQPAKSDITPSEPSILQKTDASLKSINLTPPIAPIKPVIIPTQQISPDNEPRPVIAEKPVKLQENAENRKESPFSSVKINKSEEYALFFNEDAVLYVDRGRYNTYEESQINSRLLNTGNIHRIGPGKISFDGFKFFFEDKNIRETYQLDEINNLSFYSNCFTITKKQTGITSIFFIDSTVRIKAVLDYHRMIHAPQ